MTGEVAGSGGSSVSFGGLYLTIISALIAEKDKFNEMGTAFYPDDYGPKLLGTSSIKPFDFIIVGSGPAGCVLANRLTENPNWSVLLLEAGDAPSTNTEIPYLYPTLAATEDVWSFTSESDNFCLGSPTRACQFRRGKALGGSSTINNLHYERGTQRDFNCFRRWDYLRDIIPSYASMEKYLGNQTMGGLLGTEGELALSDLRSDNGLAAAIVAAAKELAYDRIVHPDQELGYKSAIGTVANGERNNMAKAFLAPVRRRANLFVARNCLVTKILTDLPEDRRVAGVAVRASDGATRQVRAKREVVLCAGAVNTAKLLLTSGFGPRDQLRRLNVSVVVDLPVGQNLRDQIGLPIFVGVREPAGQGGRCRAKAEELDSAYYFLAHREGKLTGTGLNNLEGAINTRKDPYTAANVKVYHQFFETNDRTLAPFLTSLGYKPRLVQSLRQFNCQRAIVAFIPTIVDTKSVGQLTLGGPDYSAPPTIRGNYLSDPERSDYYSLASAYDFIRALAETEPLATGAQAQLLPVLLDDCKNYNTSSDQYVNCYIRSMAIPMGQVVGTARVGDNTEDEGAMVVNDRLLVEGIRHLRVVDASVIPEPISANVESTVAMLGVKIAEDIKRQWSN